MKVNDKVQVFMVDKYVPCVVDYVEDARGYKGYAFQKVWVKFEDGTKRQYRDFDIQPLPDEEPKKDKKKKD